MATIPGAGKGSTVYAQASTSTPGRCEELVDQVKAIELEVIK
jgi:hypothetical protein